MAEKLTTNRYLELDALRGIAALMVVLFHISISTKTSYGWFKMGTVGVDLFFIISGFVIFMSLSKVNSSLDFIINRFCRLFPSYWTCVTLTYLLIPFNFSIIPPLHQIDFVDYIGNLTMFQFYLKIPDIDGPYWTMITELLFYIFILLLYHFKILRHIKVIGIIVTSLVVTSVVFFDELTIVKRIIWWIPLLQFLPLFLSGIIFYKIMTQKSKLLLNYCILLFCLLSQILLFYYSGRSYIFIHFGEYVISICLIFTTFILFANHKLGFIINKITLFLGKISFALYLIHQFLATKVIIPFFTEHLHINYWVTSLLIALPVVVILATIITYSIEIPLGKRIKKQLLSSVFYKKRITSF